MSKCNHTKDYHGYYLRFTESFKMHYTSNGRPDGRDDDHMHRGGTVAYCENCHTNLGKVVTLADGSVILASSICKGE